MISKESFRQKAKEVGFSEEDISRVESIFEALLSKKEESKGGFNNLVKNFFQGYNTPGIWKLIAESILIFCILIGISVLGYSGKLDPMIVATMISVIIGFVFGKMR